jgi:excisionase family DNA binding protein
MPVDTTTDAQTLPPILTMRHVKDYLRISRDMTYRLPHISGFPVVRLGRAIRVPREAFLRWIEEQASQEGGSDA